MVSQKSPSVIPHVAASEGSIAILSALQEAGGVIIEGLLSPDQVKEMNKDLNEPLSSLDPGSKHSSDSIKSFHGVNTKRLTGLTTCSKTFRDYLLDHDLCHDIAERIFHPQTGTYWLSTAQVIEIGPGNKEQVLHRDQGQFQVFDQLGPNGPEATINFLVALTDFTEENGATRVIPGSHKWLDFSVPGNPEDTIPAEMKAGDACLIFGKTVHGGGANKTASEYRRAISFPLQASFLTPEEAYTLITPKEIVKGLSLRAQRMIGFRSQFPKGSPGLWQANYSEIGDQIGLPGVESAIEQLKAGKFQFPDIRDL
ncbi:Multifunctional dioxygenase ausE [Beauveria bassiana]|uniref:Phytanoyl-CoA dioxygenase n=1 Tax=Beauveria bassiana (strain ARSEF 2860) TaxID=655819 RepID=J4VUA1_BEAB2|nr:phytanoyl-CoA dioxygenase [Beauveria bassiana ARSEF 2860]EJP62095.1 phytanoyl-CoA dioxygenase [Beauveria bassiana ARSEF 2860]KAF1734784.1 Multifunctional dioxygenase ausE [Beauveria bassiana]KAH8708664.1 Dioxygenase FUM3 [Beauveria bassiana]